MPGLPHPTSDEKAQLLGFLAQQRYVVRLTAHGLDDDQIRQAASPGVLTVGGIIKHLGQVERSWMDNVCQQTGEFDPDDYVDNFAVGDDEGLATLLRAYEDAAEATDATLAPLDLDHPVPVPHDVPWFPADVDAWTVRWVILHLITETARHAGHADIVREGIDGATAYSLMAAAEHWPASPWLTPWEPTLSA